MSSNELLGRPGRGMIAGFAGTVAMTVRGVSQAPVFGVGR